MCMYVHVCMIVCVSFEELSRVAECFRYSPAGNRHVDDTKWSDTVFQATFAIVVNRCLGSIRSKGVTYGCVLRFCHRLCNVVTQYM